MEKGKLLTKIVSPWENKMRAAGAFIQNSKRQNDTGNSRLNAFMQTFRFQLLALVEADPKSYHLGTAVDGMPNKPEDYVQNVASQIERKIITGQPVYLGSKAMAKTLEMLKLEPTMQSVMGFINGGSN